MDRIVLFFECAGFLKQRSNRGSFDASSGRKAFDLLDNAGSSEAIGRGEDRDWPPIIATRPDALRDALAAARRRLEDRRLHTM